MRKRVLLGGHLAGFLRRLVAGTDKIEVEPFAGVVGGEWGGVRLDALWGRLRMEGPDLVWKAKPKANMAEEADVTARRMWHLRNELATLSLADGSSISARFGTVMKWQYGARGYVRCKFTMWDVKERTTARARGGSGRA